MHSDQVIERGCGDAIDVMYVLKASLRILRCSLDDDGVVLDNEDELDDEIKGMIDRATE